MVGSCGWYPVVGVPRITGLVPADTLGTGLMDD